MKTSLFALLMLAGTAWFRAGAQDPTPAPKPASAPVSIEGMYRLTARMVAGKPMTEPGTGYLSIHRRFLFVMLANESNNADVPAMLASVQEWQQTGEVLETEVLLGCLTDMEGEFHLEPKAQKRKRRVELARGALRIYQDKSSYLEFERVE